MDRPLRLTQASLWTSSYPPATPPPRAVLARLFPPLIGYRYIRRFFPVGVLGSFTTCCLTVALLGPPGTSPPRLMFLTRVAFFATSPSELSPLYPVHGICTRTSLSLTLSTPVRFMAFLPDYVYRFEPVPTTSLQRLLRLFFRFAIFPPPVIPGPLCVTQVSPPQRRCDGSFPPAYCLWRLLPPGKRERCLPDKSPSL